MLSALCSASLISSRTLVASARLFPRPTWLSLLLSILQSLHLDRDRLFQLQPFFLNASSSLPSKFPTLSSSGPSSSFHLTVRSSFSDTLFSTFHFIFHFLSSPPATSTCFTISFNFHSCLPACNLSFISYRPSVFLFSRQPAVHSQPGPANRPPSRPPVTSF